jgi:hypothetical protein
MAHSKMLDISALFLRVCERSSRAGSCRGQDYSARLKSAEIIESSACAALRHHLGARKRCGTPSYTTIADR